MTKPFLSIIIPGIRTYNWEKVYHSIVKSTDTPFEVIFCGPNLMPPELTKYRNIKYIRDFGSPVRCSNIAATLAEGDLITWSADDGMFVPKALNGCLNFFFSQPMYYKNVVVWKYIESGNNYPDVYYRINHHKDIRSGVIPDDTLIFNGALMYKRFFDELGGWDNEFQTTSWSHTDMAIRAKMNGARTVLYSEMPVLNCYQEDAENGDHEPIATAFVDHDQPYYRKKFDNLGWINREKSVDLYQDWKNADIVWRKRFSDNEPHTDILYAGID